MLIARGQDLADAAAYFPLEAPGYVRLRYARLRVP